MKAHLATILTLLIIIGGGYLICVNFTAPEVGIGALIMIMSFLALMILRFIYLVILEFIEDTFFY